MDHSPADFLPMEFPRQEYWSGLPFPSPGDRTDPEIQPTSPELAGRTDAFELWCWIRLLRVPWSTVNPKGNQSYTLIGRTDAEAEAPMFWPSDAKNQFSGKDPFSGKD